MLEIVSRAESGLPVPTTAAKDGRAHSLVLHHWGSFKPTTNARVRELRQLHLARIGSNGEAYNWLVGHDAPGKAWELRGRGRRPGSQKNVDGFDNNVGTRSIVVNGDYRNPGNPSGTVLPSLVDTIARLVVKEHRAGDMPAQITHGHTNYLRPDGNGCCQSTSCPGVRLVDAIPTINARIQTLLATPLEADVMTPEQEARLLAAINQIPKANWDEPGRQHDGGLTARVMLGRAYKYSEAALVALRGQPDVSPEDVAALVLEGLDAKTIAAALSPQLAADLLRELSRG